MPGDGVERRFLVVKLYSILSASRAGGCNLRDCCGISVGESFRRFQHQAIGSPIGDAAQIGKRDSRIFLQDSLSCNT